MSMIDKIDEVLEQYELYEEVVNDPDCDTPEKPKFEVTDKSSAEWVMRKISKIKAQIEEDSIISMAQTSPLEDEIIQIKNWFETENAKHTRSIEFLISMLEPYHRSILEVDPKAKTIKLPHGTMSIKKQQPEYQKNDDVMVDSLTELELEEFIKTKQTPDWSKLKPFTDVVNGKVVHKETGAVIGGIVAVDRPDKFTVTPNM
jgi:phage host-nuclease inhibitor protein Gam